MKDLTIKGFILKIQKAKNEDIIVNILSEDRVQNYYRFYGARHSILQLGYLIDFEIKESGTFMPQVRSISHLGFNWLYNREKLMLWHKLIINLEPHFRDINEISPFYFNLLLESAKKWEKQSSKRITIETILHILKYEGRLYNLNSCIICNRAINEDSLNIVNSFLPTHTYCSKSYEFKKQQLEKLFETNSTINLDDAEVEKIFNIIIK